MQHIKLCIQSPILRLESENLKIGTYRDIEYNIPIQTHREKIMA